MATIRKLPALVRERFQGAQKTGDLTFYATKVSILRCDGLPFQLRFSPALANKPKSDKPPDSKPVDPFLNPPEGLFITDIQPCHILVLNKFPVIPDHFILATKNFQKQTDLLEKDDIGAAYACMKAYRENGEELFGFFNSGQYSGASQPHRHIQFLPVESMRSGLGKGSDWRVLADILPKTPDLPFTYFSSSLPKDATPAQLHGTYTKLYEQAVLTAQRCAAKTSGCTLIHPTEGNESRISYNLGLTDRAMVLCPRAAEGMKISNKSGDEVGSVSLNGTILGGTLLVKNEDEWDALRNDESKLKDVLSIIGIPPINREQDGRL